MRQRAGSAVRSASAALACLLGVLLAGCREQAASAPPKPAAVGTVVAQVTRQSSTVSLTGEIKARVQSDLSFRFAGRLASRMVDVGDSVQAGQLLATLETAQQEADLAVARAGIQSAQANVTQLSAAFGRQKALLDQGVTTRSKYDDAQRQLIGAQTALVSAGAELETAQDQLDNATLRAPAAGIITARFGEVGQVLDAAQAMYSYAADGDRDAVFDVYEALVTGTPPSEGIQISLLSDPAIRTTGKVREVAPAVDSATGTIKVKIGLEATPPAMRLGSAVVGVGKFRPRDMVSLPWTAFFTRDGQPAVWVLDPQSQTVSLRAVTVDSYRTGEILLSSGIRSGETVVVAGVQRLYPGELVTPQPAGASQ